MGVARQAPAPATGRLGGELKAQGQHEGEDTLEKRLAVSQQAEIGGFVSKIDGDSAVFAGLAGSVAHGHPSVIRSRKLRRHNGGNPLKYQDHRVGLRALPLKSMECGFYRNPSAPRFSAELPNLTNCQQALSSAHAPCQWAHTLCQWADGPVKLKCCSKNVFEPLRAV